MKDSEATFYGPINRAILDGLGAQQVSKHETDDRIHRSFQYKVNRSLLDAAGFNTGLSDDVGTSTSTDKKETSHSLAAARTKFWYGHIADAILSGFETGVEDEPLADKENEDTRPVRRECIICAEEKAISDFQRLPVTRSCTHIPRTCLSYAAQSIRSEMDSKRWTGISCPECDQRLAYVDIQEFADKDTFARYEVLALRAAMDEADSFIWCTNNCGSGQIHESGEEQPIVTCTNCGHRSCFNHQISWHEDLSCEDFDRLNDDPENFKSWRELEREQLEAQERERTLREAELARQSAARRKKEEGLSKNTVEQTTKPCPQCAAPIEKNSGCAHMTCRSCRHEFCWICMERWARGQHGLCASFLA